MAIISKSYVKHLQADGSFNVDETYIDSAVPPNTYSRSYNAPASLDIDAVLNQYAIDLADQLANQEFEMLIASV